jgi:ABC-type antimicrobial peptide transport system permease subunit
MRDAVRAVDTTVPISSIGVLTNGIAESRAVARRRFVLTMLSIFAGAALVLAVVGLYGNIAYSVAQRARELAIRSALGADSRDVLALVLGAGIRITAAGVIVGGFVTLGMARVLSSLLFGVGASDPLTYLSFAGLLGVVALVASFIPARRALRTDPAMVMRSE